MGKVLLASVSCWREKNAGVPCLCVFILWCMCVDFGLVKGLVRVWDEIEVHACASKHFRAGFDWFISQARALHPWSDQPSFSGACGSGKAEGSKLVCFVAAIGGA